MQIINRKGETEPIQFDKITNRLNRLNSQDSVVDTVKIAQKVVSHISDRITTKELDELSGVLCMELIDKHPDYGTLGARIAIDNHHKNTDSSILQTYTTLYNNIDVQGNHAPLISTELFNLIKNYTKHFQEMINYERDFLLNYFGFQTLAKSYLLRVNKVIIERPQHLFLRVSIAIHARDFSLESIKETYDLLSTLQFVHATPTLFHAGTGYEQMCSCFLGTVPDSVEGIFDSVKSTAILSKWAGGVGLSITDLRADGSYIRKTGGYSSGIVPYLRTKNALSRYINQSGKRNGSFAMYIEPWHADILSFLSAKKNHGNEEERARDLFYGLWIPDLFMKCVENDDNWYLMCPDECRGLSTSFGDTFENLYNKYVQEGKFKKMVRARDLFLEITTSQKETGLPYMLYKDACNKRNNQSNLGVIKNSNLCCEIIEFSNENEIAVCNLASIALPTCVEMSNKLKEKEITVYCKKNHYDTLLIINLLRKHNLQFKIKDTDQKPFVVIEDNYSLNYERLKERLQPTFNYDKLSYLVSVITRNLNKIIDKNFYPLPQNKMSNLSHRPIGIGVQGLADVFIMLGFPFDSEEANEINSRIFETIYYSALETSHKLAVEFNEKIQPLRDYKEFITYTDNVNFKIKEGDTTFPTPLIKTLLSLQPTSIELNSKIGAYSSYLGSPMSQGLFQFDLFNEKVKTTLDWENLRTKIMKDGVRNSLLIAPMPTASTSQILGNNECIEPYTSNLYSRRTLSGEFTIMNKHLINDLMRMGLWNEKMRQRLIINRGSVQKITQIPETIRNLYKTAWEIKQKIIVDLAAGRQYFIDQSQSLNVFMENPTHQLLTKYHLYAWKKGLKTGSYYIRSKPASTSQQFTIDPKIAQTLENEPCEMCSS